MKTVWKKEPKIKPVIYFRICNDQIMYIGETSNINGLRPWRYELEIGEYDYIITVPACSNERRRRYWEAYCIVKFKPLKNRNLKIYHTLLNKKYSEEEINLKLKKIFPDFRRKNLNRMIKTVMLKKIYALDNSIIATKQLKILKEERRQLENNCIRTTRHRKDRNFIR